MQAEAQTYDRRASRRLTHLCFAVDWTSHIRYSSTGTWPWQPWCWEGDKERGWRKDGEKDLRDKRGGGKERGEENDRKERKIEGLRGNKNNCHFTADEWILKHWMFISTVSRRGGQPVGKSILSEEAQRHDSHFIHPLACIHLCAHYTTCIYTPFSRTFLTVESSAIVSTSVFFPTGQRPLTLCVCVCC